MLIPPSLIEEDGRGICLSDQPREILVITPSVVRVTGVGHAATFLYDKLPGIERVRLTFMAMDAGGILQAPPASSFGRDVYFDGVAVSGDGVRWYEIQDLRHLGRDGFTAYDLDLDALVAALGLSYGSLFQIRFCQHIDNESREDRFTIKKIRLEGVGSPPVIHLPVKDSAPAPTVLDLTANHYNQESQNLAGIPNTNAHSVPGIAGLALFFDGEDASLLISKSVLGTTFDAESDFALALWWRSDSNPFPEGYKYILRMHSPANGGIVLQQRGDPDRTFPLICASFYAAGNALPVLYSPAGLDDNVGQWHHYVLQRRYAKLESWRDGELLSSRTDSSLGGKMGGGEDLVISGIADGAVGSLGDLRIYNRALLRSEIWALANMPQPEPLDTLHSASENDYGANH